MQVFEMTSDVKSVFFFGPVYYKFSSSTATKSRALYAVDIGHSSADRLLCILVSYYVTSYFLVCTCWFQSVAY